ncbi:hypothetical protein TRICHSKD4_0565 [Roseibium sp. TrichSKD4]|uniref:hypothetical protein n=1 Tax=Roseibium sp. TrichSKD4 TaxID=744980 RepID=UPI0001E5654D|nr:hypothetical protein [Roseibium sp. TrichSKD4]EFO34076.1 hypothetical protein TRICHSKD4_0565 [Roseibium sp. TrichSKD4]
MEKATPKTKTYFENAQGIKVTNKTLSTRYKDEAILANQSVIVGREPLIIGGILGLGLILFCYQFGDLLYWSEMFLIISVSALILVGGYSIAALRVGQYMQERTIFWHTIWTVQNVRMAIARARNDMENETENVIIQDIGE